LAQIGGTTPGADNLISANGTGLQLRRSTCVVQGNRIGTDVTGTQPLGNTTGIALDLDSSLNTIGGTEPGAGNLISGNGADGIDDNGGGNVIQGNLIGTDRTGTHALPNHVGVYLHGGSDLVGGTVPGAGNVISGNVSTGLGVHWGHNTIEGNLIGTDRSGTAPLGNGGDGVQIINNDGGQANTVGGTAPGAGNVIANNGGNGIYVNMKLNVIQGNWIGTDVTGTQPMGNGANGVYLRDENTSHTTIGGTDPGAGNVIAFNGRDGVLVDPHTVQNAILGNSIHDSGGLGIELNDGSNNDQAFPVLTAATLTNSGTVTQGLLSSAPNTTFTLEFFANDVCNPSGYGEGRYWLGDATVTTNANGRAAFTVTVDAAASGQFLAATATDPLNNTSAFSACLVVPGPASVGGVLAPAPAPVAQPAETSSARPATGRGVEAVALSFPVVPQRAMPDHGLLRHGHDHSDPNGDDGWQGPEPFGFSRS
jgi:hypothetical protein